MDEINCPVRTYLYFSLTSRIKFIAKAGIGTHVLYRQDSALQAFIQIILSLRYYRVMKTYFENSRFPRIIQQGFLINRSTGSMILNVKSKLGFSKFRESNSCTSFSRYSGSSWYEFSMQKNNLKNY